MTTIDTVRIIALQPLRDFDNTPEYARRAHRSFNIVFSLFTIMLMILLPLSKFKGFHSILDLGDILFWVFVPLTGMWAVGYQLQLLQSRDECNQPNPNTPIFNTSEPAEDTADSDESRGPGRPRCAQFDQSVGPLNDEIAIATLEDEMSGYADEELGGLEGRYIIDALNSAPYHFTNGEYSIQSLATWLFERFRPKFHSRLKSGNAMTTIKSERYNNDEAMKVKDRLNNKYLQLEKKQKKE